MDVSNSKLLLKRNTIIKAIVTPRWKEEVQQQLQGQINQIDTQLQQLEMQAQQMIFEIQKQSIQPPGPQVQQQIESVKMQANQRQREMLDQKNQILQNLQQVQTLEMGQEVASGQMDSFFYLERGEDLIKKMQVEVVLRDGVVEEIRGDL
ncbi:YlqD family protein [Laspinema olomoucense]|uniref:YlqD family protein n=1 Tax=Laspinema olomoucense D3b TaxID=2953688 RepID=A0ABT2N8Q7_9CYAN|nr:MULTISPECIES: YlqD family protein [unclassified Laspinema]MCT7971576.1 YlqD family protein [Laspinema sp. D3d]MCT7979068.1 YlqD family protein [Laspinema sp. D3b]MCT7987811.1 YlqD family protein [Laspinema sp. D3a]MCT7992821.1 YlqD family protein [Laspinema sp. D3c]